MPVWFIWLALIAGWGLVLYYLLTINDDDQFPPGAV
jgi:hypothetical protein